MDGTFFNLKAIQSHGVIGHPSTGSTEKERHQGLKGKGDLINLLMKIRK